MTDRYDTFTLLTRANPIPDLAYLDPDEISAELAAIETAWREERRRPVSQLQRFARSPRMRAVVAVAAAALLVLVLVGVPLLWLTADDEPPVIDEATTTTMATTTTASDATTTTTPLEEDTTIVPAIGDVPSLSMARAADVQGFAANYFTFVQVFDAESGFFAILGKGEDVLDENGSYADSISRVELWRSGDGTNWEFVGEPEAFDALREPVGWLGGVWDVAVGSNGIVAVGNVGYDGAAWFSSDGIEWTRVGVDAFAGDDMQSVARVVAGGPGFVAVGRNGSRAGVWISTDGINWTPSNDSALGDGSQPTEITDIAAGPEGFVALGETGFDSGLAGQGTGRVLAVWVSTDGVEWEQVDGTGFPEAGSGRPSNVAAWQDGFVMTGFVMMGGDAVVWWSDDGRSWQDVTAGFDGSVVRVDDDYVMMAIDEAGQVWATDDFTVQPAKIGDLGLSELSDRGLDFRFIRDPLLPAADGILFSGWLSHNEGSTAAFWIGTWEP